MRSTHIFLSLIYFAFFLWSFAFVRMFFPDLGQEGEYSTLYREEDFTEISLEDRQSIPFLRFHVSQEDEQEVQSEREQDTQETQDQQDFWYENTTYPYSIYVFPEEYQDQVDVKIYEAIYTFLWYRYIEKYIDRLYILMHQDEWESRGRMHARKIYLHALQRLPAHEVVAVFIHEFWHYYDIFGLKQNAFGDISDEFYRISWESTSILRPGSQTSNFVSGYAMTNKYEDFAESYTYYILHNEAFVHKAKSDPVLQQKYNFFADHTFVQNEFKNSHFWISKNWLPYYWDTTKIETNTQKLLQYIQNTL